MHCNTVFQYFSRDRSIYLSSWYLYNAAGVQLDCNLLSCDTLPPNTPIEWNDAHRKDKETQGHGLPSSQSINGPQCNQQPCVRKEGFPRSLFIHIVDEFPLVWKIGPSAQQYRIFSYLGTLTRWSTAGPCSRQSSDIYTPSCSAVPSYFLWRLTAAEQNRTEFRAVLSDCSLSDWSVPLLSYKMDLFLVHSTQVCRCVIYITFM